MAQKRTLESLRTINIMFPGVQNKLELLVSLNPRKHKNRKDPTAFLVLLAYSKFRFYRGKEFWKLLT